MTYTPAAMSGSATFTNSWQVLRGMHVYEGRSPGVGRGCSTVGHHKLQSQGAGDNPLGMGGATWTSGSQGGGYKSATLSYSHRVAVT